MTRRPVKREKSVRLGALPPPTVVVGIQFGKRIFPASAAFSPSCQKIGVSGLLTIRSRLKGTRGSGIAPTHHSRFPSRIPNVQGQITLSSGSVSVRSGEGWVGEEWVGTG